MVKRSENVHGTIAAVELKKKKQKKKTIKKGFALSVSLSLPLIGCPWLTKSGIFVDSHVKELT